AFRVLSNLEFNVKAVRPRAWIGAEEHEYLSCISLLSDAVRKAEAFVQLNLFQLAVEPSSQRDDVNSAWVLGATQGRGRYEPHFVADLDIQMSAEQVVGVEEMVFGTR